MADERSLDDAVFACVDIVSFFPSMEEIRRKAEDPRWGDYIRKYGENPPIAVCNEGPDYYFIVSANHEARKILGFKTGSLRKNDPKAQEILIWPNRFDEYKQRSQGMLGDCVAHIRGLPLEAELLSVWQASTDDSTFVFFGDKNAAKELIKNIEEFYSKQGLEIAVGISCNESYAKLALAQAKELRNNGSNRKREQKIIEDISRFFNFPVEKFYNIDVIRGRKLKNANIRTIGELYSASLKQLYSLLGGEKLPARVYGEVHGKSSLIPLKGNYVLRPPKEFFTYQPELIGF